MDIRYLAGIVDGEGTIRVNRTRQHGGTMGYHAQLSVYNTFYPLIADLVANFGGTVYVRAIGPRIRHECYTWTLTGQPMLALLEQLEPFLIVKQRQAREVLRLKGDILPRHHAPKRMTEESIALRESVYLSLRQLNDWKGKFRDGVALHLEH